MISRVLAVVLATVALSGDAYPQDIERGQRLYDRWCAECHGFDGAGDGSAAAYMMPRPRDFTIGVYQIRTTANGELPTDADLVNTELTADEAGVAVLGQTTGSSRLGLPMGLEAPRIIAMIPGALAIVILGLTQSIGAMKRAAEQTGERIDPGQELLAIGASNLGAGLSGGSGRQV